MSETRRYTLLDVLRGLLIISMVAYHTVWDLIYIFEIKGDWFEGRYASLWQLSIRYGFIFLSGFCIAMSRRPLRRAIITLAASALITAVTAIFMPQSIVLFGVLSLIGSAMLVFAVFNNAFKHINCYVGLTMAILLFCFTRFCDLGYLGFWNIELIKIPSEVFRNNFTAYLGFPSGIFYSSDYVPLLPWIFLFFSGYFAYRVFERLDILNVFKSFSLVPLELIGRNSLLIYLAHQPIIYGILLMVFKFI